MMLNKLNFGCGRNIKEGFYNVDLQKGKGIDKSFDFNKFPYPLKDNSYDYILVDNVLEHLEKPNKVLLELYRICRNDGIIDITVPHYSNKGAYSDLEHTHFFNEVCFINFANELLQVEKKKRFILVYLKLNYTWAGKYLPFRKKIAVFINGLISTINVKYKIKK
jgi:predicted SAM-dependent methyltransferase